MTPATMLTFDGIAQPISEWALDYGIAPAVIIARLERGLSVEQAVTTPMVTARGQKLKGQHIDSYIASQRYAWQRDRRLVIRAAVKAGRLSAREADSQEKALRRAANRPGKKGVAYTFNGKTMTLREWSQHIGVAVRTLRKRFEAGWPIERIFAVADGRKERTGPGVVFNFVPFEGTGGGSTAQEIPGISFSEQAKHQ